MSAIIPAKEVLLCVVSTLETKPILGYPCVGKGDPPPSQERTGKRFGSPLLNLK